jgi:rod shape-determining protein MreD
MKRWLAVLLFGLLALGIQGGLAMVVPRQLCPDLGLLVVIAIGLHWQDATSGLLISSVLGFIADLLSSSIFGAHALLRVLVFTTTAVSRQRMDLRGGLAMALFAGGMTILYALGLFLLMGFFGTQPEGVRWSGIGGLLPHALINAICAPAISGILIRICEWTDGEASRRGLEMDARGSLP